MTDVARKAIEPSLTSKLEEAKTKLENDAKKIQKFIEAIETLKSAFITHFLNSKREIPKSVVDHFDSFKRKVREFETRDLVNIVGDIDRLKGVLSG